MPENKPSIYLAVPYSHEKKQVEAHSELLGLGPKGKGDEGTQHD